MTDATGNLTGGCLCGAVRYRLVARPTDLWACHCSMCRKKSGGIEIAAMVPDGKLIWDDGSEDHIRTYTSSDWAERGFCGNCGSSLFWRLRAPRPEGDMLSLSAGSLDSFEDLTVGTEIFIDCKPDAYALAGVPKKMTEAEFMAAYAGPVEGEDK